MSVADTRHDHLTPVRSTWGWYGSWALALSVYAGILALLAGRTPLWSDEGFTAEFIRSGWSTMFAQLAHVDVNMSVYYVVAKAWGDVAGLGDVATRIPTILSVTVAIPLVYAMVRTTQDRTVSLIAAALLAVNPFAIAVALTARSYALLLLLTTVSSYLILRATQSNDRRWWVGYAVVAVVMQYTHLIAVTVIIAHGIFALIRLRRPTPPILLIGGLLAASAAVNARFLAPMNTLAWIPPPSGREFLYSVVMAWGGLVAAPVLAFAALIAIPTARSSALTQLAALCTLVPVAFIVAIIPLQSLLQPLYLTQTLPSLCVLAAIGLGTAPSRFHGRRLGVVVVFALLVNAVVSVSIQQPGVTHEDWRTTAHDLGELVESQDTIVFPTAYFRIVTEHYARDDPGMFRAAPELPDRPWLTADAYELNEYTRLHRRLDPAAGLKEIDFGSPVWLVGFEDDPFVQVRSTLLGAGFTQGNHRYVGAIRIERLEPPVRAG